MRKIRKRRKLKNAYVILVDGDSEIVYLNKIKPSNVKIKPELPSKKRLKEQYNEFKNYKKDKNFKDTFWIIDLDRAIRNEESLSMIKDYKKNYPENILINNPCLEYWFYLHFSSSGNFSDKCNTVISKLKRVNDIFKDYDKNFKQTEIIAENLKNKINIAYKNAKNRGCDLENLISCSEMYILFEQIDEFKNLIES